MDTLFSSFSKALPGYIAFLLALCVHEYSHGFIAMLKGDDTAKLSGRLSLNPLVHADIIGTIFLPLMAFMFPGMLLIGWAKPVPVNSRNLKNPRLDLFWIAFAGPLSNVLLAFLGTFFLFLLVWLFYNASFFSFFLVFFTFFIKINLFLAVFNLIPIHPLDGGKVLARFLPERINIKLEENQMFLSFLLIILIFSGAFRFIFYPADWVFNKLMSFVF